MSARSAEEDLDRLLAFGEAAQAVFKDRIDALQNIILNKWLTPEEQWQQICKKVDGCRYLDKVRDTIDKEEEVPSTIPYTADDS